MKGYQINLLFKKELKFFERIIYFSLHYLRYIIILTQIVVIGVFFYRFKIDQDIVDLKEEISQKEEILKTTIPLIKEAKLIESESKQIGGVLDSQEEFLSHLNYLFSIIPQKIVLNKFSKEGDKIQLNGVAADVEIIKLLSQKIKNDKKFKNVNITQVTKTAFGFEFLISLSS